MADTQQLPNKRLILAGSNIPKYTAAKLHIQNKVSKSLENTLWQCLHPHFRPQTLTFQMGPSLYPIANINNCKEIQTAVS